jgi:trigger factor
VTLTIHSEEDSERQLNVTVEVPEERVQAEMRRKARQLAREVRIPGFRRGKVPYNVLVQRVGETALRADAVEDMLEAVLVETLEELDEVPYRQPMLEDMELEPLVLKMTIPLEPEVALGDYRAIRKEIEPVEVTDEAFSDALEQMRGRHQVLEEVDRPVKEGDLVTLRGEGKVADEEDVIWHEHESDTLMDPEKTFPGIPFVENVIGLSAGEEKEFRFTFPDDYDEEELVGKEAVFEIAVERVQSRDLPEWTDELAQEEGDYETLAELEEALRNDLQEQAERQAKSDLLDDVLEDMMADAEIAFPPAAVEFELDNTLETYQEQVTRSGWQWDDYLKLQGETVETLREKWRDNAIERVRRGLVLREFIEAEKLNVSTEEIDAEVDKRVNSFGSDDEAFQEQLRAAFSQGQGYELMSNDIMMEKVNERVEEIVTGNAPDLEALAADQEDAPETGADQEEE